MPSALLWAYSAEKLFLFRNSGKSADFPELPFHGRGRNGKRHLQRRFLRKRGAAVSGLALSVKPCRACQLSQRESPWHGGVVSGSSAKLAGVLAPPWGSCRAATEGLQIGGAGKNG